MRYWRSILAHGALATALTVGAAGAASAQTVLHRGNSGEPATLDPHFASGTWENDIIGDMFLGLLTEAADGEAIPGAAESWEISDDGTVYTFDLREDGVWSDGEPVTAGDFVYSLRRILTPETAAEYAFLLYPIANAEAINSGEIEDVSQLGVRAIDDATLEITLEEPTPYFLEQLTHYTSFPVPQHVIEEHGDEWTDGGTMVTNGAYTLVEWLPQTHVHVEKNDNFYDAENVSIDEVYYYPTEDRSAALRRFRAGELDLNTDFPSEQIDFIEENLADSYRINPYLGIYYYPINANDPALSDVRVREALNLALNREAITDQVLGTGEVPAYSFVPPLPNAYEAAEFDFKDTSYDERLEEARALMEEAGYGPDNPLAFTLRYNTSENHRRVAVAAAAMWKEIYVEADLFNTDVAVHYDDLQENDFQVARAGWIADFPDAINFLELFSDNNYNYGRWMNEDFNALLAESATIQDEAERFATLQQAEAMVLEDYATIPIYYYVSKALVGPHVENWVDNPKFINRTRWLSIDESERPG
ncbi:MAG: peptide ABC transporter substrate-binding protein [Azospirillaceae bacterium]